jgi:hypothetical protein
MTIRVRSKKRSSRQKAIRAVALGSGALLSTLALASVASAGVLLFTTLGTKTTTGPIVKWIEPLISILSLGSLTSSIKPVTPVVTTPGNSNTTTTAPKPAGDGTTPTGLKPMKVGVVLSDFPYFSTNRAFMNLLAGSSWNLQTADYKSLDMPKARMDANSNIITLNPGEVARRPLNTPTKVLRGVSADIICRWEGKANVMFFGDMIKNIKMSGQSATFTFMPKSSSTGMFMFNNVNASNPIRSIDCREKDADPNALFDPTFLDDVKRYNTIRFVKWNRAVEGNAKISWAERTKANGVIYDGKDGVPLEYMVQLANTTKTNPWFNIPWNADDDYIRNMATYIRDNLDPTLVAHVETSNEVWNWVYPVTSQARDEGKANGLGGDDHTVMLRRYAERTGQVMDIWSSVFAGKMSRIVRVLATQNSPSNVNALLTFRDTAKKVDAVATAPYFDGSVKAGEIATDAARSNYFATKLPVSITWQLGEAKKSKDLAAKYGLRYITYEGGQHVLSPNDNSQMIKLQRDARMGQLYTQYMTKWRNEIGDLMMLYSDYGGIGSYGAWGAREYIGQPLTDAPKANAVDLFQKSYGTK